MIVRPHLLAVALVCACGGGGSATGPEHAGGHEDDAGGPPYVAPMGTPSAECGSVRFTEYASQSWGFCEFDRTLPILPAFVRDGLTAAIAQPFIGGSYDGEPGEGCGECWELDTLTQTLLVMVADQCPIQGNSHCTGEHFHMDLSIEAATALGGTGIDEARARRRPCPVEGNIHAVVNDANPSYIRLTFVNHRIPLRSAEYRGAGDGVAADNPWVALERSNGAWAHSHPRALGNGGDAIEFRLTSSQGQLLETEPLPVPPEQDSPYDLGVQTDELEPEAGGACVFEPPADVFADDFGGIPEVRWFINAWGEAFEGELGAVDEGCYGGSGSCLRVETLGQFSGFHLYYPQAFPTATFRAISLRLRSDGAPAQVLVAPGGEAAHCEQTVVDVSGEFSETTIVLDDVCSGVPMISGITLDNEGELFPLVLDDVRFQR